MAISVVSRVGGREGEGYISPDVQRESIEAYASELGGSIAAWHDDQDFSGGNTERPMRCAHLDCRSSFGPYRRGGACPVSTIDWPMKAQEAKSNGAAGRARNASNGRHASSNGDWRARVQAPRVTDPAERRAALKRATSRIKTDMRVDLTRERHSR
jgi:hypothetical protein